MYFFYSLLLTIGVVALLPRFIFDAARHGKYVAGLRERLGQLSPVDARSCHPVIWLHCVSVGETQAARQLARALLNRYPSHALVISTTTLTGQRLARDAFGEMAAMIFYFPFDWAWTVRRALGTINPSLVLLMETELWPRFLRECRLHRMPVVLVNGRISENSFRRYKIIKGFMRRVVNDLTLAIMQTDMDAARISGLGLETERVKISGNIKFDADVEAGEQTVTGELRERFRFDERCLLLVAASTHAPEESVVLEAFKQIRRATNDKSRLPRLLIAPRHLERFTEVAALLKASGLNWTRRSALPTTGDAECDVILLDSIGELRAVYPLADVVFIGGSIAHVGGHNILEPASAAKCIITGAYTSNFASIVRGFLEQDALVQLPPVNEQEAPFTLAHTFQSLIANDERRHLLGGNARAALEQSRGATARTIEMLAPLLNQRSEVSGQRSVLMHRPASNL